MSTSADDTLRSALAALSAMRARLEALETARTEPIAIVGMGCRFPGGADTPATFWRLLIDGIDAIGDVPEGRWSVVPDGLSRGGFLREVDGFDADFFGISPREAAAMDPQQRLLLEVAHEALEDAGQPAATLGGTMTGVFVGVHSHSADYWTLQADDADAMDVHTGTGTSHSVLAGRLSYLLDLRGPSIVVDTACSSSLVAVHQAVHALRAGECTTALAAGVNLILSPAFTLAAARMGMLSADGRCRTFDARADGFVRGEGCGVVVLKRLSAALADGDRVRGVIRGSAVNQDGRTNGLTAPSGGSQEALIRQALANAGVDATGIGYVEAHGTGTPLGDPIELEALGRALGAEGDGVLVGSVKTNVGHLEGAAGIAGLIKATLALEHGVVPPNVHFERLSPHIDLSGTRLRIAATPSAWTGDDVRRAGVSSFGWSGTNAHIVLEQSPAQVTAEAPARPPHIVPVSARSTAALRRVAADWRTRLAGGPASLTDVAYTAAVRRDGHDHRDAVVCDSADALLHGLDAIAAAGTTAPASATKLAFIFPGQGSQWSGMARGLLASEPVFRAALHACDHAILAETGHSVLSQIDGPPDEAHCDIDVVQPTLFAVQVALAALWRSWGITPDVVVGHSMGEVAAAHVAGALDLHTAVRVICRRSALLRRLRGRGAMAVVNLAAGEVAKAIAPAAGRLSIAAHNSPRSTVVAGDPAAVRDLLEFLRGQDVFCRKIDVDVASHSPQVDVLEPALLATLSDVASSAPHVPMLSTVTGERVQGETLDARYWARNVRQPVRFAEAVDKLIAEGVTAFLELSPHPVLLPAIEAANEGRARTALLLPSMRRDENERTVLLDSLAALYRGGRDVAWQALYPAGRMVSLPTYPWKRRRYWLAPRRTQLAPAPSASATAPPAANADWFHSIEWHALERTTRAPGQSWLLLGVEGDLHAALAAALRSRGHTVQSAADEAGPHGEVTDVVYVCPAVVETGEVTATVTHVCAELLEVAQSLPASARLHVVTRGAQSVRAGESASPIQAALWGFGVALSAELPGSWGGLIDLDAAEPAAAALIADALCTQGEERIALRAGSLLGARLVKSPIAAAVPPSFRPDRTYLVTGGLGGIGRRLTEWLVERGARHILLCGRSAAVHAAEAVPGVRIDIVAADVAVRADVDRVLAHVAESMPPLGGVFHCAAVLDDGIVARQSRARLERVLAPKAGGAWNLHEATRGLPLDVFVLFSSAAGVVGSPGQTGYAAANAFLDALAFARRAEGVPASSVSWGRWADVGLATSPARGSNLERLGFTEMDPRSALDALGVAIVGGATHTSIMAFDARAYTAAVGARPALLVSLAGAETIPDAPGKPSMLARLEGEDADRMAGLRAAVRAEVAAVLRIEDTAALDATRGFFTIGMDSLMAVELRSRLQNGIGCALPSTIAFDHPSIDRLSAYIAERVLGWTSADTQQDEEEASLDDLSLEELDALLADELRHFHGSGSGR